MKNSTKITLILILITNSLFGAQPYKVKKCKHKLVQSPRVIVADADVPMITTVEPTKEIKEEKEKVKSSSVKTAKVSKTSTKAVDLSLVSSSYVPTAKQLKRAKRLKKRLKNTSNNQLIAALLALILGLFGIHRFYLGYIWQGILQLVILGGLALTSLFWLAWIWVVIDLVRIILGNLKPKKSDYEFTI